MVVWASSVWGWLGLVGETAGALHETPDGLRDKQAVFAALHDVVAAEKRADGDFVRAQTCDAQGKRRGTRALQPLRADMSIR